MRASESNESLESTPPNEKAELPEQERSDGGAVLPHVIGDEMQRRGDEHVSLAQIFGRNNSGSLILKTCKRRGVAGDARLEGRKARRVYQRPVEIGAKFTKWLPSFCERDFRGLSVIW